MSDDEIARMRAESDQTVEGLRELGRQIWSYYSALLEAGFDKDQALTLTISFQAAQIAQVGRGDEE